MNVYAIKGQGWYGGGMAIVAAADEEWAKLLAAKIKSPPWKVDYFEPEEIILLPLKYDGSAAVLEHFETGE